MRMRGIIISKIFIIIFLISLFSNIFSFTAEIIENKGVLLTWQSKESLKEVQILYSPSGKSYYKVAVKRYSFPKENIKDTFLWIFKPVKNEIFNKIKEKAKIKIVYIMENNNKKEEILNLKDYKLTNSIKIKEKGNKFSNFFPSFDYGTYPNWPMFQVDPQHTGQYNYAVYPPLEYQWTYTLDYNDFLMISASISSNGVIYVGDGGRFLRAIDIRTGQILWEKGLTANVWTTALVNDTLVLAGTSISFDTTMPTLFLINARTGDTVWGRHFPGLFTVEFQPIVVDSLIYVTTLTKTKSFAISVRGNLLWDIIIDSSDSPGGGGIGYENEKIFIGGGNKMYGLSYFTGNILWNFETEYWLNVIFPLLRKDFIYFFSRGSLYALSQDSGILGWLKSEFSLGNHSTPSYKDSIIFFRDWADRNIIYALNSTNGEEVWKTILVDTVNHTPVITFNNFLWTMSEKRIYTIDPENGKVVYNVSFPGPHEYWRTPWFWPLIYGPYVIITHLKNMFIYKGAEFNLPQNKDYFIFYPTLIKNQGYLYLNFDKGENLRLEIFDIIGRKRKVFDLGYVKKGSYFYVLALKDLSKGVYILKIKNRKQKFLKGD